MIEIIAEAGVNHNGDIQLAYRLVEESAKAGANVVKFQTFRTSGLVTQNAALAQYQAKNLGGGSNQYALLTKLELTDAEFKDLKRCCTSNGIEFLSTPFDPLSLRFLCEDLEMERIKIGSGDLDNLPLLHRVARYGRDVILSSGMATLSEIELSLGALAFGHIDDGTPSIAAFQDAYASDEGQVALRKHVTLLHCTTEYPAPFETLNLHCIETLRKAFRLPVGFSDHSVGYAAAVASVPLGSTMLEKHVTLDVTMPGPDHKASLPPSEFADMVRAMRAIEVAMGDGVKRPAAVERRNARIARKVVVAARDIALGEALSFDNLTVKRSSAGEHPAAIYDLVGRTASRGYLRDEAVTR